MLGTIAELLEQHLTLRTQIHMRELGQALRSTSWDKVSLYSSVCCVMLSSS